MFTPRSKSTRDTSRVKLERHGIAEQFWSWSKKESPNVQGSWTNRIAHGAHGAACGGEECRESALQVSSCALL